MGWCYDFYAATSRENTIRQNVTFGRADINITNNK